MAKNVLIVGGSSGLGRQLARLYAEQDWHVGVAGRRKELLLSLEQEYNGKITAFAADISDENIGAQIITMIHSMNGIDLIIIAASIVEFNESMDQEKELKTVDINVRGYMQVMNTAWHYFVGKGSGHIAGVTSIAAARGNKMAPAYHASKAFQSKYLESLRVKSKHDRNNITITELIPGYIDTAMGKGDRLFWVAPVDKAARQSMKAISSKRSRAFITRRWWLVFHFQRVLPIFIYDAMANGSWKLKRKY